MVLESEQECDVGFEDDGWRTPKNRVLIFFGFSVEIWLQNRWVWVMAIYIGVTNSDYFAL